MERTVDMWTRRLPFGMALAASLLYPTTTVALKAQRAVEQEWTERSFFSFAWSYRVTVSQGGAPLVTLETPKGVRLSVYCKNQRLPMTGGADRFEYHGDVEIRSLQRHEEDTGPGDAAARMATA